MNYYSDNLKKMIDDLENTDLVIQALDLKGNEDFIFKILLGGGTVRVVHKSDREPWINASR